MTSIELPCRLRHAPQDRPTSDSRHHGTEATPETPGHWWEQIGGPPPRRPGLTGPREADVCIVGAGYTGLWTAVALLQARPSLEVVVLEREYAGFGASGRNGGWVVGALTGSRARWIARAGNARALALVRAAQATVDEVGRFVADEGIECDFVKGGSLRVAQSKPELAHFSHLFAPDLGSAAS